MPPCRRCHRRPRCLGRWPLCAPCCSEVGYLLDALYQATPAPGALAGPASWWGWLPWVLAAAGWVVAACRG